MDPFLVKPVQLLRVERQIIKNTNFIRNLNCPP